MHIEKKWMALLALCAALLHCSSPKPATVPKNLPAQDRALGAFERLERIKLTDLDGKPVAWSAYSGKPLFLNFWATWCGPCVSEMQSIEKASQQFKGEITFLAVSNESAALIQSYLKKNPYTFSFARFEGSYLDVYVPGLPTTLLIDAKGELVSEETGFRNWASPSSVEQLRRLAQK